MTWEANIQNLVKIGAVKITRRDEAVIHQRLADAEAYLVDTRNVTTTQSRFLLAFEGVRQASLAVANHAGIKVIPSAQHKVDVSQLAVMVTQLESVVSGCSKNLGSFPQYPHTTQERVACPTNLAGASGQGSVYSGAASRPCPSSNKCPKHPKSPRTLPRWRRLQPDLFEHCCMHDSCKSWGSFALTSATDWSGIAASTKLVTDVRATWRRMAAGYIII
ncbi:hypothetical protein [Phyllobacterium bourgognense]|uniref:Uncharacterized protein n=1 Tax=Phyllobacterium bourgognense TaxID=314236 RepID=A0A368YVZ9_9HYPH|nr:hypothetical protein [Phyllobacterium bourgognense]RCW83809.1 hypothetical protein C7476_105305 [Phyllobacterium bourgognense]